MLAPFRRSPGGVPMQWRPFYSPFPSLKKASFNNLVLKYGFLFRLWFSPWRAYKTGEKHVPPLHLPSLKKCILACAIPVI